MNDLFTSSSKKTITGITLVIVVILLLQWMGNRSYPVWQFIHTVSRPAADNALRHESILRIAKNDKGFKKVIFIGTSQTREAFDVARMNDAFQSEGIRFYNLGMSGGSPLDMYMQQPNYNSLNPDLIIYMPYVGNFYRDYDTLLLPYYFHPRVIPFFKKHFGKTWLMKNWGRIFHSFLGYHFILYRYRDNMDHFFREAMGRIFFRKSGEAPRFECVVRRPDSYFEKEISDNAGKRFYESKDTNLQFDLFETLMKEWKRRKTKVIVFQGPVNSRIYETYSKKMREQLDQYFLNTAQKIGFVYLREEALPDFRDDEFVDFTHFNDAGRKKMAEFMINFVSQQNL